MSRAFFSAGSLEPAETLGDTTPGAFDALPPLHHPAVIQAADDLRLPGWAYAVLALVFVAAMAAGAIFPWGFARSP